MTLAPCSLEPGSHENRQALGLLAAIMKLADRWELAIFDYKRLAANMPLYIKDLRQLVTHT